jgi:hypothetical protein
MGTGGAACVSGCTVLVMVWSWQLRHVDQYAAWGWAGLSNNLQPGGPCSAYTGAAEGGAAIG